MTNKQLRCLAVVIAGLSVASCQQSDQWLAIVYPDAQNPIVYRYVGSYPTLGACRIAASSWVVEGADYECGLNCRPLLENDPDSVMVCKKTRK